MARNVKSPGEWVQYIPEAFGNRDDDEPVTVEIHWLSGAEFRKYRRQLVLKQQHGDLKTNTEEINARLMEDNVRNVRNYSVNGEPIKDGHDLFMRGEPDIVEEVLDAITNISRLEKGLGKASTPSFAGSSAEILA